MLERLTKYRRDLHRIPEIRFDLPKTHEYVKAVLEKTSAKLEVVAGYGFLAYFDNGKPHTAAFRADMDALPIQENHPDCEFASTHPCQMHACGHDGHMSVMLVFAEWVNEHIRELPTNVLIVFQPAEETGGGGKLICDTDAMERYNVHHIFALHVDPTLPMGAVGAKRGEFMPCSNEIIADVYGQSVHVALHWQGTDALLAATRFVSMLEDLDRSLPEDFPHILKICMFKSGTAINAISDHTSLCGSLRTFRLEDSAELKDKILAIGKECEKRYGVRCDVKVIAGYPPVYNEPAVYDILRETLADMNFIDLPHTELIAEDFAFFLQRVPGVMFKLGLGTGTPLHTTTFTMDERALVSGVEAFIRLAKDERFLSVTR